MTTDQMAATLDKVTATTRASIEHTENLRRDSSPLDSPWAIDQSCCTNARCSCKRSPR